MLDGARLIVTATIVADKFDEWMPLMIESINWTDKQVFVVDKPERKVLEVIEKASNPVILYQRYEHESKGADGKQRNVYLRYLKENHNNDFCLVIDTDEVLSDNGIQIREINIDAEDKNLVWNVKMHHFFWNLSLEDASQPEHYCPARLFRINQNLFYPEVEHPVLKSDEQTIIGMINNPVLFHYGKTKDVMFQMKKYKVQCIKSNIHNPEQLELWKTMHVYGVGMPLKQFSINQHPKPVKDFFEIKEVINGED